MFANLAVAQRIRCTQFTPKHKHLLTFRGPCSIVMYSYNKPN